MESYITIEKRLHALEKGESTTPIIFITNRNRNAIRCTTFWIFIDSKLMMMKQYHSFKKYENAEGTTGLHLVCNNPHDRCCRGSSYLFTGNENVLTVLSCQQRVKLELGSDERLNVQNYSSHEVEQKHVCNGLSFSEAFTVFIRSRILSTEDGPVSLEKELRLVQQCPRLSKVKVDINMLKKAVAVQNRKFFEKFPETKEYYAEQEKIDETIDLTEADVPPTEVIIVDSDNEQNPAFHTPAQTGRTKKYVYETPGPVLKTPEKKYTTPVNIPVTPKRTLTLNQTPSPQKTPGSRRSARLQARAPKAPELKKRFKTKGFKAPDVILGNEDAADLPEEIDMCYPAVTPAARKIFKRDEESSGDEVPFSFNAHTPDISRPSFELPNGTKRLDNGRFSKIESETEEQQDEQPQIESLLAVQDRVKCTNNREDKEKIENNITEVLDLTIDETKDEQKSFGLEPYVVIDELDEFINGSLPCDETLQPAEITEEKSKEKIDLDITDEIPFSFEFAKAINPAPCEEISKEYNIILPMNPASFCQGMSGIPNVVTTRKGITRKHNLSVGEDGMSMGSRESSIGLRALLTPPPGPSVNHFHSESFEEQPAIKDPISIIPEEETLATVEEIEDVVTEFAEKPNILKTTKREEQPTIDLSGNLEKVLNILPIEKTKADRKQEKIPIIFKRKRCPDPAVFKEPSTPKDPSEEIFKVPDHIFAEKKNALIQKKKRRKMRSSMISRELQEKIENFQNAESSKKLPMPSTILNLPSVQDAEQIIALLREFRRLLRS